LTEFFKYHGTGNDFILIDDRERVFSERDGELVSRLCNRRTGIGADGLILIRNSADFDFEMVYFNSDGRLGSFCGNGSRCAVSFAQSLGMINTITKFFAADGVHHANIQMGVSEPNKMISVHMKDVDFIEPGKDHLFMDTGSPHYVRIIDNISAFDVVAAGKKVRYSAKFRKEGTNVNFVEKTSHGITVRTYERGVEDETLSCGTGVTASAIAAAYYGLTGTQTECAVETPGGNLKVTYNRNENTFNNIWLSGPAVFVYKGLLDELSGNFG
jgi:diaminopimelate epimerase